MDNNLKTLLTAGEILIMVVSANIISEAIYTNSKIGTDWKKALLASGIGLGATFLLLKNLKQI
jgi:hypothetical protein